MESNPQNWLNFESKGNIGKKILLNPHLFREMSVEILRIAGNKKRKLDIADIGAGTGDLSREFLHASADQSKAILQCSNVIEAARNAISGIMNLEAQTHYLKSGSQINSDPRISYQEGHADELPFKDHSLDLTVSRQVLMHLSPLELQHHFMEIERVLRKNCTYIFTVTGEAYEKQKMLESGGTELSAGECYEYPHGPTDSQHFLRQYHHTEEGYIRSIEVSGLSLIQVKDLTATIPGFERSHSRYYDEKKPNSVLFTVRKK